MEYISQLIAEYSKMSNIEQVSFFLTLVGFAITFRTWFIAKNAQVAAREARDKVNLLDVITEFNTAFSVIGDLKAAQYNKKWSEAIEHYSTLRKLLATVRTYMGDKLTVAQQRSLSGIAGQLHVSHTQIQDKVAKRLQTDLDQSALTPALLELDIQLHEIFTQIRTGN